MPLVHCLANVYEYALLDTTFGGGGERESSENGTSFAEIHHFQ